MLPARLLLLAVVLAAATAVPARAAPPPVDHGFDFWLGDWDVVHRDTGRPAGRNRIEARHDGRVLVEHYSTPGGYTGTSLNAFDVRTGRWHQCWMDNQGGVLDLYGGPEAGRMILVGETPAPAGGRQLERITWTPNPDGTVRQHWEQSADGGRTWTTAFDGLYRRRLAEGAGGH